MTTPDLASYDFILVNTSAGKDSQAMMDVVYERALGAGVTDRLVAVHCDLGRVEWDGTLELARKQSEQYGLRFEVVRNSSWPDLLARIEARGKWPDAGNRYCTSEFKTGQVKKLATRLVRETREAAPSLRYRQVRILNCLGLRAQESPARAKKPAFKHHDIGESSGWTNTKRHVDEWLPIHDWTTDAVWRRIRISGVPHHPAYDLGMPRLSCAFCVFASRSALTLAAQHNPELGREYAAVEVRMGHRFRKDLSIAEVVAKAEANPAGPVDDWAA